MIPVGYERIRLESHGEWWLAEFAINGRRAEPFWVHKSIRDNPQYRTEDGFYSYLCASADTMLEQFGTPEAVRV